MDPNTWKFPSSTGTLEIAQRRFGEAERAEAYSTSLGVKGQGTARSFIILSFKKYNNTTTSLIHTHFLSFYQSVFVLLSESAPRGAKAASYVQ